MKFIKPAAGIYLDRQGEIIGIPRKRFKAIMLLFGWKLVKEEKDDDYRERILKIIKIDFLKGLKPKVEAERIKEGRGSGDKANN